MILKRLIFGMFLIAVMFGMSMTFVGNVHAATFQDWQIENGGGQYSESNGVIRLWGTTGVTLYEGISPQTDFSFSLQVNAAKLGDSQYT